MKIMVFGFGCLVLAACGRQPSPLTPTGTTAPSAAVLNDEKGPNHFAPAPIRGFDAVKWHDLTYKTPKYVFGRALVDLAPTADNLKKVAESQGIQYLGKDLVAFADGTVFDCIYDIDGPKARWQFQLSH